MVYLYLLICIVCIVLQGFFASSEISFISSNALRLRHRQDKGDKEAGKVYEFISNKPEKFLVTTLVGTNIFMVLSTCLLTFFLIKQGIPNGNLWITFIFTPIIVIFAELVPKDVGRVFREDFSCRVVGVISFFEKLFLPIVGSIEAVSKFLVKVFLKRTRLRSLFVTKEEIRSLVREIESQGGIDRGEKEAIEEVFEFRSDKVKDVCVGVRKMIAFDYSDSYQLILETVKKYKFTRYPVFRNKEVIGYVNIFDLFYGKGQDWQQCIRLMPKVGFNQKLHQVFTRLKSKKESIALVLKGKKIYGIITIQDIIRETITSIIKI